MLNDLFKNEILVHRSAPARQRLARKALLAAHARLVLPVRAVRTLGHALLTRDRKARDQLGICGVVGGADRRRASCAGPHFPGARLPSASRGQAEALGSQDPGCQERDSLYLYIGYDN